MADDLPDAPWATAGGNAALPDAPWAAPSAPAAPTTASSAEAWARGLNAPRPAQSADYLEELSKKLTGAREQIEQGARNIWAATDPLKGHHPTEAGSTIGGLADIASGFGSAIASPATAAFRHYVSDPEEKYIGIPAEKFEEALLGGIGAKGRVPLRAGAEPFVPLRPPPGESPLGIPSAVKAPAPFNMGEMEGAFAPEPPPGGAPAAPAAPVLPEAAEAAPVATPRENVGVRLLNPDVPHAGRASVGAAAADVDPLAGYSPEAVARARAALAENGLDSPHVLEQVLDETSQHHTFGELAPGLEQKMGGIASADTGEGRNTIVQTLRERAREAPQRMAAVFDRVFGEPQNRADLQREIEGERAKTATPLWRTFTSTTVAPTPEIRSLLPRLDAAGALKAANKAMREEGLPAQQGFGRMVTDEAGEWAQEIEHVPTAAAFQYAKEHLDSLIERSLAEPGGAKAARRYTQLKNDLVRAIDNHPDPGVAGVWKEAREAWQRPTELLDAQKLGKRLLTNHIDREDVPHLTAGWSPERLEHLEIGLRGYLEDLEKANRNPRRVSNRLMDAVLSPGNQEKIRAVLGDERADELISSIRHEEAMHGAPDRIYGGSATSGRESAKAEFMAPPGVAGEVIAGVIHPKVAAAKMTAKAGINYLAKKREAKAAKLREELARMFTTQGAERDAVARALIGAEAPPAAGWSRPGGGPSMPSPGVAAAPQRPVSGAGAPGGWRPVTPEQVAAGAQPAAKPAPIPAEAAALKGRSLLEFLASKGGLEPTPDLMGILGKNKNLGPRHGWVFRKGGLSEDKARELAAEAGYIVNEGRGGIENRGGGTSTIRDLHEAINDEARGRKRYAMGEERLPEISPEEARHRSENDILDHLDREGVPPPPSSEAHQRMIDLVEKEGLSPLEAHERAIMEDFYAGQDAGLPAAREIAGKLPDVSHGAPKAGASAQAKQASAGEGSRPASPVSGEGHPGTAERTGHGPNVEKVKRESAVRLADRMGVTPQIQHMAMTGKSDAEIAHYLSNRLPVDSVRMVREHLGIGPVSPLMGADEDIPFPLRRNVLERDVRGRPLRTSALPVGNENAVLEAGHAAATRGPKIAPGLTRKTGEYQGEHGSPDAESGAPMHEVTANGVYPADFYSHNGLRYYGTGEDQLDAAAYHKIVAAKDNPSAMIGVYRALPWKGKGKAPAGTLGKDNINPGDWVTISREYAKVHGESALNGKYVLAKRMVPARDLFTAGDSFLEWGWHPQPAFRASGGAVPSSPPLKTRQQSNYSATAGKPERHCGADAKWPHGFCEHFRKHNKCELVAGFIATKGLCDWYKRAPQERANGGRVVASNIDQAPSEAQKEAGNYAKDHVRIHGLDLTIENAKGKERRGVGRDGKPWSVTMPAHYGYIKRTEGADGDHVDVYLGPHTKSRKVFVVDQRDAESKEFDEHKVLMGFGTAQQAREAYHKGFSDGKGRDRLGHMREMSIEEFKDWLAYGNTGKPVKDAA